MRVRLGRAAVVALALALAVLPVPARMGGAMVLARACILGCSRWSRRVSDLAPVRAVRRRRRSGSLRPLLWSGCPVLRSAGIAGMLRRSRRPPGGDRQRRLSVVPGRLGHELPPRSAAGATGVRQVATDQGPRGAIRPRRGRSGQRAAAGSRRPRRRTIRRSPARFRRAASAWGRQARAAGVAEAIAVELYFRKAAIDGMTDPFFLEIILNPDVLPLERPFVLAHEWAHLAGYADESEANFVAWLTCIRGVRGCALQRLALGVSARVERAADAGSPGARRRAQLAGPVISPRSVPAMPVRANEYVRPPAARTTPICVRTV